MSSHAGTCDLATNLYDSLWNLFPDQRKDLWSTGQFLAPSQLLFLCLIHLVFLGFSCLTLVSEMIDRVETNLMKRAFRDETFRNICYLSTPVLPFCLSSPTYGGAEERRKSHRFDEDRRAYGHIRRFIEQHAGGRPPEWAHDVDDELLGFHRYGRGAHAAGPGRRSDGNGSGGNGASNGCGGDEVRLL